MGQLKLQFNSQLAEIEKAKEKTDRNWRNKLRELEERMVKQRRDEMDQLENVTRSERVTMMEAQRISVDAVKAKLDENHNRHLRQVEEEHGEAIELLQQRLVHLKINQERHVKMYKLIVLGNCVF